MAIHKIEPEGLVVGIFVGIAVIRKSMLKFSIEFIVTTPD